MSELMSIKKKEKPRAGDELSNIPKILAREEKATTTARSKVELVSPSFLNVSPFFSPISPLTSSKEKLAHGKSLQVFIIVYICLFVLQSGPPHQPAYTANTGQKPKVGPATTATIQASDQYIYTSAVNLTGTTVTSTKPIIVISGTNQTSDPEEFLVEHVLPDDARGKHYVLFIPFQGSEVRVAAYGKNIFWSKYYVLFVPYGGSEAPVAAYGKNTSCGANTTFYSFFVAVQRPLWLLMVRTHLLE